MMRIDTSGIAGWEDKCVVLEFEHELPEPGTPGCTVARLVEFVPDENVDNLIGDGWVQVPGGYQRILRASMARCSLADQFCRETGRRVALRRLAAVTGRATYTTLRKAAIRQYFQDRAARKRGGAAA